MSDVIYYICSYPGEEQQRLALWFDRGWLNRLYELVILFREKDTLFDLLKGTYLSFGMALRDSVSKGYGYDIPDKFVDTLQPGNWNLYSEGQWVSEQEWQRFDGAVWANRYLFGSCSASISLAEATLYVSIPEEVDEYGWTEVVEIPLDRTWETI